MNFRFLTWAAALIFSLVISGICLRYLALSGVSYGTSLLSRGLACAVLVILFAALRGHSLRPKKFGPQLIRALVAGLALSFFTMSYKWLSASAIAVLSNVDVPFLVVLGPVVGISSHWRTRLLALLSISFLIWFVSGLEMQTHLIYGLSSVLLGTFLLCFGYFFIKRSMRVENEAVTILVPSLAIIVYGFFQSEGEIVMDVLPFLFVSVLSGASMFFAYYATMRLYEQTDLATAEFPTLLASLVIQPLEALFLHAPLQFSYVLSSLGFVIMIYILLRCQNREPAYASS